MCTNFYDDELIGAKERNKPMQDYTLKAKEYCFLSIFLLRACTNKSIIYSCMMIKILFWSSGRYIILLRSQIYLPCRPETRVRVIINILYQHADIYMIKLTQGKVCSELFAHDMNLKINAEQKRKNIYKNLTSKKELNKIEIVTRLGDSRKTISVNDDPQDTGVGKADRGEKSGKEKQGKIPDISLDISKWFPVCDCLCSIGEAVL